MKRGVRGGWGRLPGRTSLLLGSILLVATVLRGIGLSRWSLWLDEIYTVELRSQAPLRELLFVPYDPHPPLYFIVVTGWTSLVGTSPVAVRSLSLLLSVGVVFGMFVLGRKLYDTETGLIAAALFAVSTSQIHFGRDARMYPLLLLTTILSISYLFDLRETERRATVRYLIVTTAMLYTHIYGLFVVLGQNLAILWRGRPFESITRRRWLGIQAVLGALYLPWGLYLLDQVARVRADLGGPILSVGWIPAPSLQLIENSLSLYAGSPWELYPVVTGNPTTTPITTLVLLVFAFAILAGAFDWDEWSPESGRAATGSSIRSESLFLAVLFITIIVVPYALSSLLFPIYFPRFTLPATVPLVLVLAYGLRSVDRRPLKAGLLAILVGSSLLLTATYYDGDSVEPWDAAVTVVEDTTDAGDLVVLTPEYLPPYFEYYYDGAAEVVAVSTAAAESNADAYPGGVTRSKDGTSSTRICVFEYDVSISSDRLDPPPGFRYLSGFEDGIIRVDCFGSSGRPSPGG